MFNVIGTTLFVILCILTPFTDFVAGLTPGNPVAQIANAFIDCIKTGKKLPSHIDTVVITAQMMQAIYDSADQHREIVLD